VLHSGQCNTFPTISPCTRSAAEQAVSTADVAQRPCSSAVCIFTQSWYETYSTHDAMPCFAFLQDIFNLLPNMNVEALSTSLAVKGNDMMAVIYLASLIRRCMTQQRSSCWTMANRVCDV